VYNSREQADREEGEAAEEWQRGQLDSFMISVTPYCELRRTYGEGYWDRPRFATADILFAEDDCAGNLFLTGG